MRAIVACAVLCVVNVGCKKDPEVVPPAKVVKPEGLPSAAANLGPWNGKWVVDLVGTGAEAEVAYFCSDLKEGKCVGTEVGKLEGEVESVPDGGARPDGGTDGGVDGGCGGACSGTRDAEEHYLQSCATDADCTGAFQDVCKVARRRAVRTANQNCAATGGPGCVCIGSAAPATPVGKCRGSGYCKYTCTVTHSGTCQ